MIKSMTGYGRAREQIDGYDITAEIKSVNNKILDLSVKLPRAYSFAEERVKPLLQQLGVCRGKIDVYVSVTSLENSDEEITVDRGYAEKYINALKELRDTFGLTDDISVMTVASNRDVFTTVKKEDDLEADWARIKTVLEAAIAAFNEARAAEGARLVKDIKIKLGTISGLVTQIDGNSAAATADYEARLRRKLAEVLADTGVAADENRILTECAIFADRVAVDEELVRLRSHVNTFNGILDGEGPVGRTLDFWCQEMNREANTTGSKAQNSVITGFVVSLKHEIEKIREQIQNLE